MKQNKRGMLLTEEVIKIVIAVIGIALLVYLLAALYYNKTTGEKLRQAEEILNGESEGSIKTAIQNLDTINPKEILISNPTSWHVFGFAEDKKPNSCTGKNCICICARTLDIFDKQIKQCDKKGACLVVENLNAFEHFKIKRGELTSITISKSNNKISIIKNES